MIKDPKGRYIGIIQDPSFAVPAGTDDGWWVLMRDGSVYFGRLLDAPETGFGLISKQVAVPDILMEELAAITDSITSEVEEEWDDEEMDLFANVLLEGLGGTREEAEEIAEVLLETSDREGQCPWKLAAIFISGYNHVAAAPPAKVEQPIVERDAKVIPFPLHKVSPPFSSGGSA